MYALVQERYGPPMEVLGPREIDPPEPGEDEVLAQIHAASVNPADWHLIRGEPYLVRLMAGLRAPKTRASAPTSPASSTAPRSSARRAARSPRSRSRIAPRSPRSPPA